VAAVTLDKLSLGLAWGSLLLGAAAFASYASGYRTSIGLPDVPRPNVGPGFSEAATAMFGGAFIGWWLAGAGTLLACLALVFGKQRRFKLMLGLPALLYFIAPFLLVR